MSSENSDELTPQEIIEQVSAAMVPFICERTGMQRKQVERVLEAWNQFWLGRPRQLEVLWSLMHDEDD